MIWKEKLQAAVKFDADTDPKAIKNFISEANEILEATSRKLTLAIHDMGFVIARTVFSTYWTDMNSKVQINDEASGYYTKLTVEREMSAPFSYTVYVLVTLNGIKINRKKLIMRSEGFTLGDDGFTEEYGTLTSLTFEGAKSMSDSQNVKAIVDQVMEDFVKSYEEFLSCMGKERK